MKKKKIIKIINFNEKIKQFVYFHDHDIVYRKCTLEATFLCYHAKPVSLSDVKTELNLTPKVDLESEIRFCDLFDQHPQHVWGSEIVSIKYWTHLFYRNTKKKKRQDT